MRWGRAYFAVQFAAGAAWWIAVAASPWVRETTLGSLDPVAVAVLDIPLFVIASAAAAWGSKTAAIVATGWTSLVAAALAVYATITTEAGWGVLIMAASAAGSVLALSMVLLGRIPSEWLIRGPLAFRSATIRTTPAAHVTATLVQIVVFWGAFLIAIPFLVKLFEDRWAVDATFPWVALPVGIALLAAASALGLWAASVMSTRGQGTPLPFAMANHLVIAGPYSWVRNPMAVAGIVQGVGIGLILSSWLVIVYAILGSLLWNYAIRPHEERDLEERFGDAFRRYQMAVACWIPRVPSRWPFNREGVQESQ
ncbi:MAG TPA: isoprenylcysteine carboxylmethyltransferase family protein [Lacisediminihabitans sp.]|nr:isoprenylcysteine carboxylmethyltransferase family protein [Lacisediminihabitans sp.]HXD60739.1 isoprenylcysteine carboxylmethyltransferase family protein [Lacisediminihabitans sp.]